MMAESRPMDVKLRSVEGKTPAFVSPLKPRYDVTADPLSPIIYEDRREKPVVRVKIIWFDGSVDEEMYHSVTEGRARYQNLRALMESNITCHVKDVRLEMIRCRIGSSQT